MPSVDRRLIFDLGMHLGLDTQYYLQKGFRVVALEAVPWMIEHVKRSLTEYIVAQQLIIVERALWSVDNEEIPFYVNNDKHDWSSAFKSWAEKDGHHAQEISVKTTTLAPLLDQYGIPHYIKCDIEGADELFVRQLMADQRVDQSVSRISPRD